MFSGCHRIFLLKKSHLSPTSSALVSTVSLRHGARRWYILPYLSFSQLTFFAGGDKGSSISAVLSSFTFSIFLHSVLDFNFYDVSFRSDMRVVEGSTVRSEGTSQSQLNFDFFSHCK